VIVSSSRDSVNVGRSVFLVADDREGTADSVERLMGTKAEARFAFISDKAEFASDDLLGV
jgi:topoisomerase IV subunit B